MRTCDYSSAARYLLINLWPNAWFLPFRQIGALAMAQPQNRKTWYLAQLKPNSALIASRNLTHQGIETFLPLREETEARGGRFMTATKPLFPGYIFVALDTEQSLWRKVNATYGITKLVSFGALPAPVPEGLVEALKARCGAGNLFQALEELHPGDEVQLTKGPLATTLAKIESVDPDQRVWVLIDIMGRPTRVAVDPETLRRADT